jgi:hypothetical protein
MLSAVWLVVLLAAPARYPVALDFTSFPEARAAVYAHEGPGYLGPDLA